MVDVQARNRERKRLLCPAKNTRTTNDHANGQRRRRASRVDSANLPDDAATAAEAAKVRSRLEREAPIRGLAKYVRDVDVHVCLYSPCPLRTIARARP